ncbi:retron Ec67 family RNA-directed DNA polymerase/endonuclease [Pyruvatibacter sp.]
MENTEKLRSADSIADLATLIGYRASTISYILYHMPEKDRYSSFEIEKKSGGKRKIEVPTKKLGQLQNSLANYIGLCREEWDLEKRRKSNHNHSSHGIRRNTSIYTNATRHASKRFVFNVDIEDFFPTINFGRVRGYFLKNAHFGTSEKVATLIAQIACNGSHLPQGSPLSPIISDLVGEILDARLTSLTKKKGVFYTRYFDDLTFSTRKATFPSAIAAIGSDGKWEPGTRLISAIERAGFKLNLQKTSMQYRDNRQSVTSLTVNKKANTSSKYYKDVRAKCNSLFRNGVYYEKFIRDEKTEAIEIENINILGGKISHIYYINRVCRGQEIPEKTKNYTGILKLYERFLKYKLFASNTNPLVVCEGPTDNIYLTSAIREQHKSFPELATILDGKVERKIQFLNLENLESKILGISGGSSKLVRFFWRNWYENQVKQFSGGSFKNPVIVLIDNDSGSDSIFSTIKQNYGISIEKNSNDPFFHICRNLYLVKTPRIGSTIETTIEDFFPNTLLNTTIEGKKFGRGKKIDTVSEYGKRVFAEKVVRAQRPNIDFSGFSPLLLRIVEVLNHYNGLAQTKGLLPQKTGKPPNLESASG